MSLPTTTAVSAGPGALLLRIGLITAVSMTTIDQTIVALSAPTIQSELGLSQEGLQWAINAYLLATAAFFLVGGRLADLFGHRRMVIVGIAGFAFASLLCGITPTGEWAEPILIGARVLQGLSGALMFPAAVGLLVQSVPREGRGRTMATFFTITGAMTAIGPIAGGYLTQWTWRAIFWVNIPLAIIAIILLIIARNVRMVTPAAAPRDRRIDWLGAVLVAAGMSLVIYALQRFGELGWGTAWIWTVLAGGIVLLAGFIWWQNRTPAPLVQLNVFRSRGFSVSSLAILIANISFVPIFFFLSVYGQLSLGLSASVTGLLFLKLFLGFAIGARIGSRRYDRQGIRMVLLIGGVAGAAGFGWLAQIATNLDIDGTSFFNPQTWPIALAGFGIGFMLTAASTDAINRAPHAGYGEVTGITQTLKNFGGALGMAVIASIVTGRLTTLLTDSLGKFGATPAQVTDVVNQVTGAGSGAAKDLPAGIPSSVAQHILDSVKLDYAHAAQWGFIAMAIAMAVLVVLALLSPRGATPVAEAQSPDVSKPTATIKP
ncbi:EmrB/QacA subfamily drug resistance transporter [Mycetocola sp. BIGb0189]|uniref:MFS transporter n=1 Tax=Mycetocola sp. BIGb0189 TaxID=2940604 RepID=UPI002168D9AA|nr:MFS transporter [Mycetocola sp. BIGb0189]MCS4277477.1 EmrB/QacA subfamily drug resistance transporter [Mycetocola sp. BIGb0189]